MSSNANTPQDPPDTVLSDQEDVPAISDFKEVPKDEVQENDEGEDGDNDYDSNDDDNNDYDLFDRDNADAEAAEEELAEDVIPIDPASVPLMLKKLEYSDLEVKNEVITLSMLIAAILTFPLLRYSL